MNKARVRAFKQCEQYYHQHKIPALVYVPFLKLIRSVCNRRAPVLHDRPHPAVRTAVIAQEKIGWELTLRGYLSREWFRAIQKLSPSRCDQKMAHLIRGLWICIFEPLWEARNNNVHSTDNIVAKLEKEQLIDELHEWKRTGGTRLGYRQTYLLNYTHSELDTWTLRTIRNLVSLLAKAAKNYQEEKRDPSQRLITEYFTAHFGPQIDEEAQDDPT